MEEGKEAGVATAEGATRWRLERFYTGSHVTCWECIDWGIVAFLFSKSAGCESPAFIFISIDQV